MPQSKLEGDVLVTGALSCRSLAIPAGTLRNAGVAADAAIAASKQEHQYHRGWSQPNTTATAETRALHVVHGATGEVLAFVAGCIGKCTGDSTISVDLKKNGSSILTAPVQLDSGDTNRVAVAASLASDDLAVGDLLEVVIAVSAGSGTLGTGLYCDLVLTEEAA